MDQEHKQAEKIELKSPPNVVSALPSGPAAGSVSAMPSSSPLSSTPALPSKAAVTSVVLVKDEGLLPGASKKAKGTIIAAMIIYLAFVLIFPMNMSIHDHQLFSAVAGLPLPFVFAFRMAYPNVLYRLQAKSPGFWLLYATFLAVLTIISFALLRAIFPENWNPSYLMWVVPLSAMVVIYLYARKMEKLQEALLATKSEQQMTTEVSPKAE